MPKHKRKHLVFASAATPPKQLGLKAFHQNDYTTAIKHWSKPELESDAAVCAALAEAHFRRALTPRNALAACLADLRRAVELLPHEARFWYHLGLALHRADQLDDARAAYARAGELSLQHSGFGFARALAEVERTPDIPLDTLPWLSTDNRASIAPVAALLRGEPQSILAAPPGNWLERLKSLGQTNSLSARLWEGLACLAAGEAAKALAVLTFAKGQQLRAGAESVRVFYHGLAAAAAGQQETALAEWTEAARAAARAGAPPLPRLKEAMAQLHRQRLHSLQADGRWAEVLKQAKETLALAPTERPLLLTALVAANRLANAAAVAGDWAGAVSHWQTMRDILKQTPALGPLPPVLRNLAIAHEALEQWDSAAERWAALLGTLPRRALKSKKKKAAAPAEAPVFSPDEQRAWLRRRILDNYKRAGRPDQAIAHYKQAVKATPDDLDQRLELASALLANRQTLAARNEVNRILDKDAGHVDALVLLAEIHQSRGEWHAAEQSLRRVLEVDAGHESARRGLVRVSIQKGINSFNSGRYESARQIYSGILEYAPTDIQALVFLADTELVLKDKAAAQAHLETALATGKVEAYLRAFDCWAKHNNEAAAWQVLARAEAANLASPEFYIGAGISCLSHAAPSPSAFFGPPPKPKKADTRWERRGRELIQKALASNADQVEVLRQVAGALVEAHQYALALEYLRQLIALRPDDLKELMALATLQVMVGDVPAARESLRRALQLARKQGNQPLVKEIEQRRREMNDPLFGLVGPLLSQFGPDVLDELADKEPFR